MSDEEVRAFLGEKMVMQCATNGPRGVPHMMPLWFVGDAAELRGWTYAKSQKARNLERDPRATLGLEDGVQYQELRGVTLECDVQISRDPKDVEGFGLELFERYHLQGDPSGPTLRSELNDDIRAMVAAQASKRVGLTFRPTRIVSWDHRKLGGTY